MFISATIIVLYFLPFFIDVGSLRNTLGVTEWGAGFATLAFIYCLVTYLWVPTKQLFISAFASYLLLVIACGTLIIGSGDVHSSFVALWLGLAAFAAVFGMLGLTTLSLLPFAYGMYLFIAVPQTEIDTFLTLGLIAVAPLVASYIIFHSKSRKDPAATTYTRLASELSQATNKAEIVISAIDEGVVALNSDGVIELMNPAAQRIIGWGSADAVGLDYRSVLKLTDQNGQAVSESHDPAATVLATNRAIETRDLYATTGSGKRIALSIVVSPIGQPGQGVIVVFRNITRELAEEREQAEFISTASHEMRTPVASIEGYLGLALNPQTAVIDDKAREYIQKAQGAAQHLGRLFQDLLDVSKAEDGRLSNHPSIVDVGSFTGDVVEGLRPKAEEKKLRLFYKPSFEDRPDSSERMLTPVFYANVDNDHLREIVSNLVENAIKYTPAGDVIIDTKGDDEHITISIKDSGIGIPREDIPHLFQKFYRVDNSQTREIGGTGLGLYLCRRLAEVMGGRIWVESEFGKGSTFFVEIPRTDREEAMHLIETAENDPLAESIHADERVPLQAPTQGAYTDMLTPPESPVQENPTPPQPQTPPSLPSPTQTQPIQNTPPTQPPTLSAIEANPQAYMPSSRSASLKIPVRGNDPTNQP